MAKRARKKVLKKKTVNVRNTAALSVVLALLITVFSYSVPGAGALISIPTSFPADLGGYPFVFAMLPCQISASGVVNFNACGPVYVAWPGLILDVLFWFVVVFLAIYLVRTRKK